MSLLRRRPYPPPRQREAQTALSPRPRRKARAGNDLGGIFFELNVDRVGEGVAPEVAADRLRLARVVELREHARRLEVGVAQVLVELRAGQPDRYDV